jgi:hypothetical protein
MWAIRRGIEEWREDVQINGRLEKMRQMGFQAGSIGRPPKFYEKDGVDVDVADEIAILEGWDRGREHFEALPEDEQAIYYDLNRRDGYIADE